MTVVINLDLHGRRIGGIFITEIFGNFYTKRGGGFLTFKMGIPGGLVSRAKNRCHCHRMLDFKSTCTKFDFRWRSDPGTYTALPRPCSCI